MSTLNMKVTGMYHCEEIRTSYLTLCERPNFGRIYGILGIYNGVNIHSLGNIAEHEEMFRVHNCVSTANVDPNFTHTQPLTGNTVEPLY